MSQRNVTSDCLLRRRPHHHARAATSNKMGPTALPAGSRKAAAVVNPSEGAAVGLAGRVRQRPGRRSCRARTWPPSVDRRGVRGLRPEPCQPVVEIVERRHGRAAAGVYLIVQMRPGRVTGLADVADDVTSANLAPDDARHERVEMAVKEVGAISCPNGKGVPAGWVSGVGHDTVAGGQHRRSRGPAMSMPWWRRNGQHRNASQSSV